MPHRPTIDHDPARVRAAIARVERSAPRDPAAFLEGLNVAYYGRARGRAAAAGTPRSFELLRDARYLRNARELARRGLLGTRVVGGHPVESGDFADCVAVGCGDWACTGTLISPRAVVTAGHCADCATRVFFGSDVSRRGTVVRVERRVRHPRYHQGRRNDLMVLILAEAVRRVAPRRLASAALIDRATDARVVGFGSTDLAGRQGYGRKRQVDVPVASPACRGRTQGRDDGASYGCDRGFELVAGRPLLERDSCTGDSGGPLYVAGRNGEWLLAGVTSRATDSALHECGDGGIYARIDRYRDWLRRVPGVSLA